MNKEDTVEEVEPINFLYAGEWETAVNGLLWLIVCKADAYEETRLSFSRLHHYSGVRYINFPKLFPSRDMRQPHVSFSHRLLFLFLFLHTDINSSKFCAIDTHMQWWVWASALRVSDG